jgi:hypothetical protein
MKESMASLRTGKAARGRAVSRKSSLFAENRESKRTGSHGRFLWSSAILPAALLVLTYLSKIE